MFLAEVIGQVVSTKKDEQMIGRKLLLLRPKLIDDKDPTQFKNGSNTIVAVDTVGAGDGFSAAWIAAQNHGFSSGDALNFACAYAASVCTHRGPAAANSQFFAPWRQQLHQPKATT